MEVIYADGGDEPGVIEADFDDFYARGYRKCAALAYALTGSASDGDDLVQEAFTTAFRRWSEIAGYEDPLAWVRKVMVNNAMSRGRKLRRELLASARLRGRPQVEAPTIDAADRELWRLVGELPEQQAAAIALHYIDDLSVESIANVLGCSVGTVKTHLSRGRHALAARLATEKETIS
ncbi:MAG: SigE family RNA polymerase sigma factor [Ilumatobacteraceae bacterium]